MYDGSVMMPVGLLRKTGRLPRHCQPGPAVTQVSVEMHTADIATGI